MRTAGLAAVVNEIQMQRQMLAAGNKRRQIVVCFLYRHPWRDHAQPRQDTMDVRIHGKYVSAQGEQQDAFCRLRPNPLELQQGSFRRASVEFAEIVQADGAPFTRNSP